MGISDSFFHEDEVSVKRVNFNFNSSFTNHAPALRYFGVRQTVQSLWTR